MNPRNESTLKDHSFKDARSTKLGQIHLEHLPAIGTDSDFFIVLDLILVDRKVDNEVIILVVAPKKTLAQKRIAE
jgi:hypothetical protein